jgi:pyruvate,water dikinase
MTDPPLVLDFTHPRCADVALTGGKGASLATMTGHGLSVPPGFVITSTAFAAAVDAEELRSLIRSDDLEGARKLVGAATPPKAEIAAELAKLAGAVAVRSSACAEDSADASYAGQQETYLGVEGLDQVLLAVVDCWLSFFSDRAVFYRREKGSLQDVDIAVVVQQMVAARKAGVLFTMDPVQRRRDRLVIEAVFGLGEAVVSGEVTPDTYTVDRSGRVRKERVADRRILTGDELAELTRVGLHLAKLNGCPQDIEWAIDDRGLFLLQSRPITAV